MPALPPTVYLLACVSFCNDVASDMVVPLLPLLLAGPVGGGALALGAIEGSADSVASLMRLWAGRRSDRGSRRRKPLAVAGYALSNLVRPLLGLAPVWQGMLALRVVDRIGKGVRSAPRDALLADIAPPDRLGAAFGVHRAFDNGGAVVGALCAAWVLARPGASLREVVLWSALPGVLAVLLLAFGVREPAHAPALADQPATTTHADGVTSRVLTPAMRAYLRAVLLFTLSRASETFIVMRGSELGMAAAPLLLMWAGLNAAKSLAAHLGGGWADRHGRGFVLRLSWIGNVAIAAGLAWAPDAAALTAVALIGSLPVGLGEGAERACVADLAPADQRGAAYGWYNLTTGVAAIPAGLVFGGLWQYAGAPVAFGTAAAIGAAAVCLLPALPQIARPLA